MLIAMIVTLFLAPRIFGASFRSSGISWSCTSWPNSANYGCTVDGDNWAFLGETTFGKDECESLCRQHASSDGCCYFAEKFGCYWKGGATASQGYNGGFKLGFTVTCTASDCLEEDTHYVGGDIKEPAKKYRLKNIESATECQQKCQENPDCLFFTWNSGTAGGSWNTKMKNTCWLKKEKDEVEKDCGIRCAGRVSGPKDC